jgi:hypothetical protein
LRGKLIGTLREYTGSQFEASRGSYLRRGQVSEHCSSNLSSFSTWPSPVFLGISGFFGKVARRWIARAYS